MNMICEECEEYIEGYYKLCNPCKLKKLKGNFTNWTSGNKIIDGFIQKMQLKLYERYDSIVFEWISFDQFSSIEEINKDNFVTVHSAVWKDGPLQYNTWERMPDGKVDLKCLNNSQNVTNDKFFKKQGNEF